MCSTYIIDGKRCETGRELADLIGIENARRVNHNFIPDLPEDEWLDTCLCHVNQAELQRVTGTKFREDFARDAFVPVKPRIRKAIAFVLQAERSSEADEVSIYLTPEERMARQKEKTQHMRKALDALAQTPSQHSEE